MLILLSNRKIINFLIVLQLLISLLYGYLSTVSSVFSLIYYATDLINVLNLILMCQVLFRTNFRIEIRHSDIIFLFLFVAYYGLSYLWGNASFYEAFIRYRYIFGSFLFYIVCTNYLDEKTYTFILKMLFIVQTLNLFLVFYQNQKLGLHPDFSNGIFGTGYANGIQGTFCLALSLLSIIYYLSNTWSLIKSVYLFGISAIICAIAEIKIYFVIFVVCAVFIFLFQKRNLKEQIRMLVISVGIALLLYLSYKVIEAILPNNLDTFFSLSRSLSYEQRTTYAGRTNTIPFVYNNVYNGHLIPSIFGMGLGTYNKSFIYELGKTFSELGFVGLTLLYTFLILKIFTVFKRSKLSNEKLFVATFSIVVGLSIVVWNALFVPPTYIVFFFLAISSMNINVSKGARCES